MKTEQTETSNFSHIQSKPSLPDLERRLVWQYGKREHIGAETSLGASPRVEKPETVIVELLEAQCGQLRDQSPG